MNFKVHKCTKFCFQTQCHCKLPLTIAEHLQLPCCKSMHHVECISKQTICPTCKQKFSPTTLTYISNVNERVQQKQRKKDQLRKDIKETTATIISFKYNSQSQSKQ